MKRGLAALLVVVLITGFYTYRIADFPPHDNDEPQMLFFPWWREEGGARRGNLLFWESFGEEHATKYVLWTQELTNLWLRSTSVTPTGGRLTSAFFMLSALAAVLALYVKESKGRSAVLVALGLMVGLHPAVLTAARRFRMEPEVLALGVVSLLAIPLLCSRLRSASGKAALLVLLGFACGVAGAEHPMGLIFPIALVVSLLRWPQGWRSIDDRPSWQRWSLVALGFALAAAPVVYRISCDPVGYRNQVSALRDFYIAWQQLTVPGYASRVPWLQGIVGPWTAAQTWGLDFAAFAAASPFRLEWAYHVAFWLMVVACLIASAGLLIGRLPPGHLAGALLILAAAGYVVAAFIYRPSNNYFAYAGFLVPAGFALLTLRLSQRQGLAARLCFSLCVVVALLNVLHASEYVRTVSQAPAGGYVTLDKKWQALRTCGRLALQGPERGSVYTDFLCFPATSGRIHSLVDTVVFATAPLSNDHRGLFFERVFFSHCFRLFGEVRGALGPREERGARLATLTTGHRLALIMFTGSGPEDYYFFQRDSGQEPPTICLLVPGGLRWFSPQEPSAPHGFEGRYQWPNLRAGAYLLRLPPARQVRKPDAWLSGAGSDARLFSVHFWHDDLVPLLGDYRFIEIPSDDSALHLVVDPQSPRPELMRLEPTLEGLLTPERNARSRIGR